MDLVTLDMPAKEAREAFLHYKHSVEKRRAKRQNELDEQQQRLLQEDEELMAVYRTLARGRRVINFVEACSALGWKDTPVAPGLPEVAICRASASRCGLVFPTWGNPMFVDDTYSKDAMWSRERIRRLKSTVTMPRELWDDPTLKANGGKIFKCKVPVVPLRFRPATAQLKNYHVIFEAEWDLVAPFDPFLVKRLSRNFFAIVAQWDLTDIERSLVATR